MKRSKSFVWERGQVRDGWRPVDSPNFDPGGPVHVAHDTLEHFNGDESFESELMAFGSTLFGRASTGGEKDAEDQIGSSVSDLVSFLREQEFDVKPAAARWNKPIDGFAEEKIERLISEARTEFIRRGWFIIYPVSKFERTLEQCRPWIRLGYRVAARRFGGDHALLDELFRKIFDGTIMDFKNKVPEVGEKLTVSFDTESRTVSLERS